MDHLTCPWHPYEPATMNFCEANLCHWITQPANTVSGFAFIVIAFFILKNFKIASTELWIIPIASVLVGINTMLYHASFIFFFQVWDVASMFMLACLFLAFNLWRLNIFSKNKIIPIYSMLVISSIACMVILKGQIGENIFAAQITLGVLSEIYLWKNNKKQIHYKNWLKSIALYHLAFLFWYLDLKKILCWPDNHWFQGHALWHIFSACSLYPLYKFYAQFFEGHSAK